jgi:integrating conjugative element protein (TIGR03759 family)
MEGDHVLFFPSKSCESCPSIIDTLQRQLAGLKDTAIDIYVLEAANDNDVRQWALKYGIDPKEVQQGQITLNRDNGLLQRLRAQNVRDLAGGLPVFLKRDDQIYQLHPAQLGL